MQVLRCGYRNPFRVLPSLSTVPIPLPSYSPTSVRGIALDAAVTDLIAKGAVEPAPSTPGFYSRLFVTPKVTGGWRPVIDLSRLNCLVLVSHFHMETAHSVLQSLCQGDCMVSLDLQDAYLQVHPSSRHYLRFCVGDSVLQFRVLCFGLSATPHVFTRFMAPISSVMHRYGFHILRFLDDWLVLGSSFRDIVRARDFLLWLCRGAWRSRQSCQELPGSLTDFGLSGDETPDTSFEGFPDPQACPEALLSASRVRPCQQQPLTLWRQFLGVMSYLSMIVPGSHLRMRSLQLHLNASGRLLPDSASVSWDESCRADLWWWSEESHLLVGLPLSLLHPELALYTDASDTGWGAFLADDQLSGLWPPEFLTFSINLAVLYSVQGFLLVLRGRLVSLFADNTTALSYLRKQGGTHSSTLNTRPFSVFARAIGFD